MAVSQFKKNNKSLNERHAVLTLQERRLFSRNNLLVNTVLNTTAM